MSYRPDKELQSAFAEASRILDAQLERARSRLVAESVTIEDRSNRSGFEKSGFAYFLWSLWFERRQPLGAEIASVSVELAYLEPLDVGSTGDIQQRLVAEIFQTGQLSRIRRESKQTLSFDSIATGDMASLVLHLIDGAEHELLRPAA